MRTLLSAFIFALVAAIIITGICSVFYRNAFNTGFIDGIKSSYPCFDSNGNCVPYRNYVQQSGGN